LPTNPKLETDFVEEIKAQLWYDMIRPSKSISNLAEAKPSQPYTLSNNIIQPYHIT
jgi:hypothetical protein